ncbi:phospholipase D-like domain-containing protein, partial [Methylacidiphilum caldifontis]|uniref:phospholipase D-like domain-containing protein n=1 Tax=Methylacidiphilum caldifontis TaxID=2795386 RepID=UPI001ABCBD2A
ESAHHTLVLSPGSAPVLAQWIATPGPVELVGEEWDGNAEVTAALIAHHQTAEVLLPASLSPWDRQAVNQLVAAGVQVRTLTAPYVHAKVAITSQGVFVGSENWTTTSMDLNREVGIIVTSPTVQRVAQQWFRAWWQKAQPWRGPTP